MHTPHIPQVKNVDSPTNKPPLLLLAIYTHSPVQPHTQIAPNTHTHTHKYAHKYTYIHKSYADTHVHTYTHTHHTTATAEPVGVAPMGTCALAS